MSEQRNKNGLLDFSQLRRKNEDYNTIFSKNMRSCQVDLDLDSNQEIIKSFKELRQKLKSSNRQNQTLRQEMTNLQIQVRQLLQSENNLMSLNHQLKQKNHQIQLANDQWKKKICLLKEQVSGVESIKGEVMFLKQNLLQLKGNNEKLQEEKRKLIEISVEQKMSLQQKIHKLLLKKESDEKYVAEVQTELCKSKEAILKLENSIKKLEIKFDQQTFNTKWSKQNFEKEYYEKKVAQLQSGLNQFKAKNRRQKQKRIELQRRVIELQQMAGLCHVKAQVYQGQVQIMTKKVKKMERRISQTKQTAEKMTNQRINWEQKFMKSVYISQELINRVKRQVVGDMVQLAKTCEYKLNKLKETKQNDKPDFTRTMNERVSISNRKHKTDKKIKKSIQKQSLTATKYDECYKKLQFSSQNIKIPQDKNINIQSGQYLKQKNFNTVSNIQTYVQKNLKRDSDNMQLKVRKERDEMQKKLKQKMLYRKIQMSSSPQKAKLRQDYLKLIFQR